MRAEQMESEGSLSGVKESEQNSQLKEGQQEPRKLPLQLRPGHSPGAQGKSKGQNKRKTSNFATVHPFSLADLEDLTPGATGTGGGGGDLAPSRPRRKSIQMQLKEERQSLQAGKGGVAALKKECKWSGLLCSLFCTQLKYLFVLV